MPVSSSANSAASSAAPAGGEAQQALPPVDGADALFDQPLGLEFGQHAAKALLGDGEQAEEVADSQARATGDEIERAVVGAAKAFAGQDGVGAAHHGGVAEIQQLDAAADLVLAQIQRRGGRRDGAQGWLLIWDSHVDISCTLA